MGSGLVLGSNSDSFNTLLITNGERDFGKALLRLALGSCWCEQQPDHRNWGPVHFGLNGFEAASRQRRLIVNTLLINNGGRVVSGSCEISTEVGASNNQVTVSDAGSVWINNGQLNIGTAGTSSTLLITNGGTVSDTLGLISFNFSGTTNNQVIVTGANSLWTNSGQVCVGNAGMFNTLLITNGGTVTPMPMVRSGLNSVPRTILPS